MDLFIAVTSRAARNLRAARVGTVTLIDNCKWQINALTSEALWIQTLHGHLGFPFFMAAAQVPGPSSPSFLERAEQAASIYTPSGQVLYRMYEVSACLNGPTTRARPRTRSGTSDRGP